MTARDKIIAAERHLAQGDFSAAARICIRFLADLEGQSELAGEQAFITDADGDMTLLAGAITRLLTNPRYKPSDREIRQFLLYKRVVSQVFEISGYRGTAHFLQLIGDHGKEKPGRLSADERCRLLMGLSINAAPVEIVDLLKRANPTLAFLTTIAFLSEQFVWSKQAEAVRTELVKGDFLSHDVQLRNLEFKLLASAWMGCSYAVAPHRHRIKAPLNAVVRKWLLSRGVEELPPATRRETNKDRPRVLIIAELYYKDHAMDRCYSADIRSLRKYFHTTLMMAAGRHDPAIADQFDEVDAIEFDLSRPEAFIARVRQHKPDIIYLPSVGMRIGGIACANMRLAPIQVATLGHPATSHSPYLEYMVLPEHVLGDPESFTETLLLRSEERRHEMRSDAQRIRAEIHRDPVPVRLAVPAWVRKPTPQFLAVCGEIVQTVARPVEFWFFPNVRGCLLQAMKRRIESILPARVFPSTSYNEYIARINKCDIHLSTFPFGATNGIVDSARQGLPIVNMIGREAHNRVDGYLVQRLQQPDWLTATTIADYMHAVLRLVDNDAERIKISEAIVAAEPDCCFFLKKQDTSGDFGNMFLGIFRAHELMKSSGKKVWRYSEILDVMDAGNHESNMIAL